LSAEGQAREGLSLGAQRARLAAHCAAMDLERMDVVTDEMSARTPSECRADLLFDHVIYPLYGFEKKFHHI